ncbi:acyl-CoA Delta-12 desaturase [Coccinella septempunctata]|uniref:acyl-CoA Delta-12 desaturase n=1 Tax=Coccinella septempunctata TaxID=41139 RepID=UPI001D05F45C|nr:acyl-CoA Delta-12 desaturase [Coccinella septempunctata]
MGEKKLSTKRDVDWFLALIQIHAAFVIVVGLHVCVFQAQWKTLFFSIFLCLFGNLGLTAGAHRLWAHQSYKASIKLKLFLALCHTLAGTGSIYSWARVHRLHHKHFGTDLDPYNCSKGFYYAHVRGFCFKLSEAQEEALNEIDTTDLEEDKIVMFQHRYYWYLFVIIAVLLPVNAPVEYWGETIMSSVAIAGFMRLAVIFHSNLLIASATKLLSLAPGEKFPSDTNLAFLFTKTHWISYHYMAPFDYQTGEYGKYGDDCPTMFIKMCEALNLASDLKTVDSDTIRKALVKSVDEKKSLSSTLHEMQEMEQKRKDNIFRPTKFF